MADNGRSAGVLGVLVAAPSRLVVTRDGMFFPSEV
jgi:hypothetical protein